MLGLSGVRRSFGETQVLLGVDLTVEAGDRLAIIGPSGSGKTTLLHIMGLLDRPDAGTITLDGSEVPEAEDARAALRRDRLGFVFQDHHLLPQCTALENVVVPCYADGVPSAANLTRARELLGRLGLSDRADHRPHELSTGQRQRVAVARALIRAPGLVLADEPTGALDRRHTDELVKLLLDAGAEAALVVVTHNPAVAEAVGRAWRLEDGVLAPA